MLQLFQNIFGGGDGNRGRYPESLVTQAIERALEGTDARMRLLSGYARKLRPSVLHTIDHVVDLVDQLPAAIPATAASYDTSPALSAFFYSASRMTEILGQDQAWREFRQANPGYSGTATALLVAAREEKHTFGYALVDDKPMSDVAQTLVTFSHPLLRDVCCDEAETRKLLRRRAFDYVLGQALSKMEQKQSERSNLSQRRAVMRAKLALLQKSSAFGASEAESPLELQKKLEAVEEELKSLGADDTVLAANLSILEEVLAHAEKYLWMEQRTLYLEQQHMLRDKPGPGIAAVSLQDLVDPSGRRASVLLLSLGSA